MSRILNYRANKEKSYYGSDLNKFINKSCSKEMTVINIDLLIYKRSKKHIRIIESKHTNEKIPYSQEEVLKILSTANLPGFTFEVFTVQGDPPYETVEISDNNKTWTVTQQDFINWLEFKKEL